MQRPVYVLGRTSSALPERIAARTGRELHSLSLDATFEGAPVTIAGGTVTWQGYELSAAGAILVELPLFPWPQPVRPALAADDTSNGAAPDGAADAARSREALALAVSALAVCAERVPVVNPPEAAHLAVAPSTALDRLSARDLAVHPWRQVSALEADEHRTAFDVIGREAAYTPRRPELGQPGWIPAPVDGELLDVLVVGDALVACRRHGSLEALAGGSSGRPESPPTGAPAQLALDAASALGLSLAELTLTTGDPPAVLRVGAGPDLLAWDTASDGRTCAALAEHLDRLARRTENP